MKIAFRLPQRPKNIPTIILQGLLRDGCFDFLGLLLFAPAYLGASARVWGNTGEYCRTKGKPFNLAKQFHHYVVSGIAIKVNPGKTLGWPSALERPLFDVIRNEAGYSKEAKILIECRRPGICSLRIARDTVLNCPQTDAADLLRRVNAGDSIGAKAILGALRSDPYNLNMAKVLTSLGPDAIKSLGEVDRTFAVEQISFLRSALASARINLNAFIDTARASFGNHVKGYAPEKVEKKLHKFIGAANIQIIRDRLAEWSEAEQLFTLTLRAIKGGNQESLKAKLMTLSEPGVAVEFLGDQTGLEFLRSIVRKACIQLERQSSKYNMAPYEMSRAFWANYGSRNDHTDDVGLLAIKVALGHVHQICQDPSFNQRLSMLAQEEFMKELIGLAAKRLAACFAGEFSDGEANVGISHDSQLAT